MLRLVGLAILTLFVLVGTAPGQAQRQERRIALVIGNAGYQTGALATPANDAGLVAQTLQAAGFDVTGARDLDATTMRASFREFLDKAGSSGPDTVALVYFAGYGVQFGGENYLVPVDARLAHSSDVPLEAVRLTDLTGPLAAIKLKARIVVLDAARANKFGDAAQPLAGGLALMQPDPGTLIAFNAAPGTIAPESTGGYGDYATALSEMMKEGGLPLDQLFDRVRLRVSELTQGAELSWYASHVDAPFLFFERTTAAPKPQADRFSELLSKPVGQFDAHDAYLAALARDTMRGYLDFLAAYPDDPLARRVRAIVAARREAATWRESAFADTPDAYWSYLKRYPHGPHAWDARRRLEHFDAALEPPSSFSVIAYDVPPPPPDEIVFLRGPAIYFADPDYDLPPPPPVPVFFLPERPVYFDDYAPPPPPVAEFVLPVPVYYPVPTWVVRPPDVAPPPVNVINVNIHNKVVINETDQTAVVTDPAGKPQPPLPAQLPQASGNGQAGVVQAHPVASAAVAAAVAALPAAVALHARQGKKPAASTGAAPAGAANAPLPRPAANAPATAQKPSAAQTPKAATGAPAAPRGAKPLPVPTTPVTPRKQQAQKPLAGQQQPRATTKAAKPLPVPATPATPRKQRVQKPSVRQAPSIAQKPLKAAPKAKQAPAPRRNLARPNLSQPAPRVLKAPAAPKALAQPRTPAPRRAPAAQPMPRRQQVQPPRQPVQRAVPQPPRPALQRPTAPRPRPPAPQKKRPDCGQPGLPACK